jgi:uroporphyrinogen decarboxylase
MTSKERVQAAIHCQPTDRIAYDFQAEDVTLEKIFRYTGNRDADALMDELGSDIRHIDADKPAEKKFNGFYQNYWGERYVYKPSEFGPVREDMQGALATAETMEELKAFDWPKNDGFDYSEVDAQCRKYKDRAIIYGTGDVWERPSLVRGMQNFFEDLVIRPEFCHYICNVFTDFYVEDYRRAWKASNGQIDLFLIYTDLGSQSAPLISRKMLHEFVLPYLKRIADAIHDLGAHFYYHSCGMIHPFIPDLIATGVDVLDPMQPCSPLMQPEVLARDYGGKVCFHGGISIQDVLVNGTPEQVREEVARYKKAFNNTGYICTSSHLFQADAPVENIFALYDEVRQK